MTFGRHIHTFLAPAVILYHNYSSLIFGIESFASVAVGRLFGGMDAGDGSTGGEF